MASYGVADIQMLIQRYVRGWLLERRQAVVVSGGVVEVRRQAGGIAAMTIDRCDDVNVM